VFSEGEAGACPIVAAVSPREGFRGFDQSTAARPATLFFPSFFNSLILATVAYLQRVSKKSAPALESPCLTGSVGENLGAVIGYADPRA
jgi:hypothetical protein